MRHLILSFGLLLVFLVPSANAIDDKRIPEPLKPWIPWVLEDSAQWQCPFWYQDFQQKRCRWSGRLHLTLTTQGGHFEGDWTLYRPDWLILPGDLQHWPQQVTGNREPQVVITHQGKPAIWLNAGHYRIEGRFNWQSLPERLAIPDDAGLISLSVNDKPIHPPRIEQNALWLNSPTTNSPQQSNSLDIQVFRKIVDDIPLHIATVIELHVSGTAREERLPHALLNTSIPISLDSPLPARLEANGELRVQVRPGRWSLTLDARMPAPVEQLTLESHDDGWPRSELWAFQAMPELRLVEIEQLTAIDGSQTNLPTAWRELPSYRIDAGQSMVFKTLRRGDPEPAPNQLSLQRRLWLDFDGQGYTVSDHISGKMTRDWRLDTLSELQLGQALLNGQPQLITQSPRGQGLEVRRGMLQLQADSRLETDIAHWHAVGWQQAFQQVSAELNIPPGWRLLAVSGVDNDPVCWLSQWTLLDVFLLLVIALACSRLWSWHWGVLALLSLTMIWHEADAPRWIWLNTLAALGLLKVLPESRLAAWVVAYRNLCWLALMAIVIPFMITQLRIGLYPQLERNGQAQPVSIADTGNVDDQTAPAERAIEMAESLAPAPMVRKSQAMLRGTKADAGAFERIDPDAQLQTGPGLPSWQWQTVSLRWNGSVDPQQAIDLWFVSPFFNLCLHLLQASLSGLMTLKLLGLANLQRLRGLSQMGLIVLLPLLMLPSQDSYADFPDTAMLDQLKQRLQKPPECLPNCAEIANMHVKLDDETLFITLQLHAQDTVAVPMPARSRQWWPGQITVDGQPAQGLIRQDDMLWLVVTAGVHEVQLTGSAIDDVKVTLPLPLQPHFTEVQAEGWRVDGVYEQGQVGPQLEFSRLQNASRSDEKLQPSVLPPFVRIERKLHLGLDWRLTTEVHQLGDRQSAVMLDIPLLPGEAVTDPNIHVKNGHALVNMAAGQSHLSWESSLDRQPSISLQAANTSQWYETWRANVSPTWHLEGSGLNVVHHQDPRGSWLPEWRPWPGESLNLEITRPQAVTGPTMTLDRSDLRLSDGKRSEQVQLGLTLRSSKGGQHRIMLPPGALLQSVSVDGTEQAIRAQGRELTLPIHPGSQYMVLNWQTPREQSPLLTTPTIDLNLVSVNSHIEVLMGEDRWVLMTLGPRFGPAALIWGLLIVLAGLAWGLGRVTLTPLKHWQWFLLLVGLSQLHILAAMLVVTWLLALGWRGQHAPMQGFNLLQVLLGLMTLLALWSLFLAVQHGLLGSPDMQISGNDSTAFDLKWYQDHSAHILPTATVISVSLTWYRVSMLLWSLWLALSLLDWLRWGWACVSQDGLWRRRESKASTQAQSPSP